MRAPGPTAGSSPPPSPAGLSPPVGISPRALVAGMGKGWAPGGRRDALLGERKIPAKGSGPAPAGRWQPAAGAEPGPRTGRASGRGWRESRVCGGGRAAREGGAGTGTRRLCFSAGAGAGKVPRFKFLAAKFGLFFFFAFVFGFLFFWLFFPLRPRCGSASGRPGAGSPAKRCAWPRPPPREGAPWPRCKQRAMPGLGGKAALGAAERGRLSQPAPSRWGGEPRRCAGGSQRLRPPCPREPTCAHTAAGMDGRARQAAAPPPSG